MTKKHKVVIVGCGMAGAKVVEELVRHENADALEIVIIGEEKTGNYDRIKLSYFLNSDDVENFWLNTQSWFEERHVTAMLGEKVTAIDAQNRQITTGNGNLIGYDSLVLAIGADPIMPPMGGTDLPGIFTLRNLDDINNIKAWLKEREHVTIIGGGLLGIELADTLHAAGKRVTICHLEDTLMERQLAPDSACFLETLLKEQGIEIFKSTRVTGFAKNAEQLSVQTAKGELLVTDAVIVNCGITPKCTLAKEANLKTDAGITVNDKLQTSNPSIYAVGECCEFEGHTYGLLIPIYAQARVLAKTLLGEDASFEQQAEPVTTLKSDIPAITMGKMTPDENNRVVLYENPLSLIHKRLIINDNCIVGASLVGDDLNADAIGGYYTSKLPLPKRLEGLVFPGVKRSNQVSNAVYWPDDVTVCDCNGISCGAIRSAVRAHGNDISKIKQVTRAAVNCGSCLTRVEAIANNTYDAVVVGSGLGGLSSAARLAKENKRVLILEQHEKVGGFATSFTREGYTFDVSLHNLGPLAGPLEKMFENLGIRDKIEYIPFDYFQRLYFPEHRFRIEGGLEGFTRYLKEQFPNEHEGIEKIVQEMRMIREGYEEIESLTIDSAKTDDVTPLMVVKYPQFADLIMTTFEELISEYIKDKKLIGVISNLWWYLALPPSEAASILYAVVSLNYIKYNGGTVKGTSQTISNALADVVRQNGGDVHLNTTVSRILISNGKVDGVITDDGTIYYSDVVISNAGVYNTITNLVDSKEIKKKFYKKVKRTEGSISAVQLYLGLDCDPESLGLKDDSFTWFPTYDHDENFRRIMAGEYEHTIYSCTNYTALDKDLAPEGGGIINLFSLDNVENWEGLSRTAYAEKKKKVTNLFLGKIEKMLPDIRKHIVVQELGTPMTMQRYTLNPKGSIFGPSQIVYQSGLNRFKPDTPVQGLYVVGASIYPGAGYPSVISSGYRAGTMVLEHMNQDQDD